MPNWKAMVRSRLETFDFDPKEENDVINELAAHLEDLYEEGLTQGLCAPDAIERALEQVADWRNLSRKIQLAKHPEGMMNNRTKTFWLPALISLSAAEFSLLILSWFSLQSQSPSWSLITIHTSTTSSTFPLLAYLQWWIVLPFCGAAGAYLSRHSGGRTVACLMAGLFPWIATATLIVFLTLIGQIVPFHHQWINFITALSVVSVPPGVALLAGAAPFLKKPKLRATVG
ncbi:MAG: hypothetical protein ACHP8A_09345 [Terriglobales bacterium]